MLKSNEITIREIKTDEIDILEDILYESVYQSDITNPIPQDVINIPEARVYIEKFGQKRGDYCLVVNLND